MEETTVLIVGAGPSGLALAVSLSRMDIRTVILEKDLNVTEDPRGIAITGDAVRISYQLGIGDALANKIGSDTGTLYFHKKTFRNPPFMNFETNFDHAQQSVSNAINQFQPNYERTLRRQLASFDSCDLRVGCEVLGRVEEDAGVVVEYVNTKGKKGFIRTSWLVGADGKRGVVRKKFLEPEGIRQEVGLYNHTSTWIAANLEINLPSKVTHPEFALWKLGYSPEEVYDLFWPAGFHFCNDTKRPAVSGRFGPKGAYLWRHEYSVEPEDNIEDSAGHLWTQFSPWLEIPGSEISSTLKGTIVRYPQDCVQATRCRPFTFSTKVVNRWYCRRTLLIGDAAHVFPPFGGQGIATGIRDAQALSWRIGLLSRFAFTPSVREKVLMGWAQERRQACDHATNMTKVNGTITNQRNSFKAFLYRVMMRLLWRVPSLVKMITRSAIGDTFQYRDCEGGFSLRDRGGGWKLPQIWIQRGDNRPELSDGVFLRNFGQLALVIILRGEDEADDALSATLFENIALPGGMLTEQSITFLYLKNEGDIPCKDNEFGQRYHPCSREDLLTQGIEPINGYDEKSLETRIGKGAKYIILRPDFYIHSVASNMEDLLENSQEIARYFEPGKEVGN